MDNTGGTWRVVVERNRLKFAAAHMATFGGSAEPLHGHNYAVHVEVEGEVTADAWVIDFGALKQIARECCEDLDHRVLLQMRSPILAVASTGEAFSVSVAGRQYLLPASDVFALDADNSTVERIAEHLWGRIAVRLHDLGAQNLRSLTVLVEEAPGQAASFSAGLSFL